MKCSQNGCRDTAHEALVLRFNGSWFAFCSKHYGVLSGNLDYHLKRLREAIGR